MALAISVASKAKENNVRAISFGTTGRAGVKIEDQWVRAYFKFSVPKIWDNLETSSTITYEGVRVFGDPVSSVIHSTFFPETATCSIRKGRVPSAHRVRRRRRHQD